VSDQPAFVRRFTDEEVATWASRAPAGPLAGVTFAIKDNLDLAGVPTTAADPRRTTPASASATAVQRMLDAGAVPVGKTNLDQYATGLVGTRSPYGACHSVFSPDHVSGGSSSGSAVAVAAGECEVALATDTAGSGRVPAAFNGLVGLKPSRGLVSSSGLLPACRSLDCVTVLSRTVARARDVLDVVAGPDPTDAYSRVLPQRPTPARPRVGVPVADLGLDPAHEVAWAAARSRAGELFEVVEVDVAPFLEAATLLYSGPWLAERWLAFGDALDDDPAVDPTVRSIVRAGEGLTAADAFAGFHRLASLAALCAPTWDAVDALLLPVTPTHPTHAEVAADPVGVNARLGRFTNMTNLLDLGAIAVPGTPRGDGLPFGVQLLAPAGGDQMLLDLGAAWCGEPVPPVASPGARVEVAVAGAHLAGQPLNADLVARGGQLVRTTRTAADYRMYVVDGPLPRPGVTRVPGGSDGPGIEVEVWSLPVDALAGFMLTVAPPLAIGPVVLAGGEQVLGFTCTADGVDAGRDITEYGGWRAWLAR
jgi:allophanate hydrolase